MESKVADWAALEDEMQRLREAVGSCPGPADRRQASPTVP